MRGRRALGDGGVTGEATSTATAAAAAVAVAAVRDDGAGAIGCGGDVGDCGDAVKRFDLLKLLLLALRRSDVVVVVLVAAADDDDDDDFLLLLGAALTGDARETLASSSVRLAGVRVVANRANNVATLPADLFINIRCVFVTSKK